MNLRLVFAAAMVLLAEVAAAAQLAPDPRPEERGFPLMRVYDDTDHGGAPQSFAVAMDSRGYVYVGNLSGLLISDGARWRRAASPTAIFAVATNPAGQVLTGGPQALSVLEPGNHGVPVLRSIVDLLPETERDFGDVRTIVGSRHGFVVLTDSRVLLYRTGKLTTIAELPVDRPRSLFLFRDEAVLLGGSDAERIENGSLVPAPSLSALGGRRIDALIEDGENAYFALDRDRGLARVDETGLTLQMGSTSTWAIRNVVTSALRLRDGRIAFGSRTSGVLIANAHGEAQQVIDSSRGLAVDRVDQLGEDTEGGLWVVMNGGIARFDMASSITVFDARSGVQGGSQGVFRHEGRLFVFGPTGVGVMDHGNLHRIPGIAGAAWFGLETPDAPHEFLIAAATGIFRIRDDRATLIPGTVDIGAYALARASTFEGILVGARGGLHLMKRSGAAYRIEGPIAGSPRYIRSILPRPSGRVFLATTFDGIVSADLDAAHPANARFQKLGGVEGNLIATPDGLMAITNDEKVQIFGIDEQTPRLVQDDVRTKALAGLTAWAMGSDAAGNLWVNTASLRIFKRLNGALQAVPLILHSFPARRIHTIEPEADGVVWISGESGLFRHAGVPGANAEAPGVPVLANVTVDDQLAFDGWDDSTRPPAQLPQTLHRLRAEFAPLSHQRGLAYQFRLDPLDGDWSEWSPRTDIEFTTLQEAAYTLRVRMRGADGQIGPEMKWPFVVNPPWHRTVAARLGSILALLLLLGAAVALRTRVLRREAERLTQRVEEKTRDLQAAVRDLEEARLRVEEQNRLLESANARLEDVSRHDALTGIANRRQFDVVLREEWLRARRQRTPLAVGILDLDHFKDLNDAHGHPEGDEALRQVAKSLQISMRRPADLVARYGGEEFAFILSNTDLAGALLVAEEVRARIEGLKLRNPGAPGGHLSASVGLVAAVPADGLTPETLIEAADRALYAAKDGGRNRVRAAEVNGA